MEIQKMFNIELKCVLLNHIHICIETYRLYSRSSQNRVAFRHLMTPAIDSVDKNTEFMIDLNLIIPTCIIYQNFKVKQTVLVQTTPYVYYSYFTLPTSKYIYTFKLLTIRLMYV